MKSKLVASTTKRTALARAFSCPATLGTGELPDESFIRIDGSGLCSRGNHVPNRAAKVFGFQACRPREGLEVQTADHEQTRSARRRFRRRTNSEASGRASSLAAGSSYLALPARGSGDPLIADNFHTTITKNIPNFPQLNAEPGSRLMLTGLPKARVMKSGNGS